MHYWTYALLSSEIFDAMIREDSVGSQADLSDLVSYLLVRTHTSMLQRYQPE